MDKRTLIILIGLLLPIIALALLAQSQPAAPVTAEPAAVEAPANVSKNLPPAQTLEEARARAKVILDTLNKMTPEEWDAQQKRRHMNVAPAPLSEQPHELPAPQEDED
jgi:hypothetical protein